MSSYLLWRVFEPVYIPEEELSIEIAKIDRVHINDMDLLEACQG